MNIFKQIGQYVLSRLPQRVVLVNDGVHAQRNNLADQILSYGDTFSEINASYHYEFLRILNWLAVFNPDVSQTVKKVIALGNVGHSLEINGKERAVQSAVSELNDLSKSIFGNKGGADGFINLQFRQILVYGALCQEIVPSMDLQRIEKVYQVKNETIRFRFEDNEYRPYQETGTKPIKLNENTFLYLPIMTEVDSPYALPPFIAALRDIIRQDSQLLHIDRFVEKWGVLGFVHMVFDLKRRLNESEKEFTIRAEATLKKHYDLFTKKMKNGVAVTGDNVKMNFNNISRNAAQMKEILQATHQNVTSGLNIDPAMLGYTYSTTETYAGMVYKTLLNEIKNTQRIIKRANEYIYNMHLVLHAIPATCSIQFKSSPSLNEKDDMEAKKINQDMVLERKREGIIDADTAARELGYDEAYKKDNEQGNAKFKVVFNCDTDRYEITRPVIRTGFAKKKVLTRQ